MILLKLSLIICPTTTPLRFFTVNNIVWNYFERVMKFSTVGICDPNLSQNFGMKCNMVLVYWCVWCVAHAV